MVDSRKKKGSIRDLFFIIAFLFFLGIAFFISFRAYFDINAQLKTTDIGTNAQAVEAMDSVQDTLSKVDYFFLIIFIMLIMAMLVSSFMVPNKPIFYVVFILAWIFAVMLSVIMSVVY